MSTSAQSEKQGNEKGLEERLNSSDTNESYPAFDEYLDNIIKSHARYDQLVSVLDSAIELATSEKADNHYLDALVKKASRYIGGMVSFEKAVKIVKNVSDEVAAEFIKTPEVKDRLALGLGENLEYDEHYFPSRSSEVYNEFIGIMKKRPSIVKVILETEPLSIGFLEDKKNVVDVLLAHEKSHPELIKKAIMVMDQYYEHLLGVKENALLLALVKKYDPDFIKRHKVREVEVAHPAKVMSGGLGKADTDLVNEIRGNLGKYVNSDAKEAGLKDATTVGYKYTKSGKAM